MKPKNTKKPHLDTDSMVSLYQEGLSTTQIGKQFGIGKSSVSKRLRKAGVLLKTSSAYSGPRRYWLWKGDDYIDPVTRKRNQLRHRKWSLAVRKRDNHTCQDCEAVNVRLEAHHVVDLRDCINSDLEFDLSNGITLCRKCHKHRHKEQGI